jgi:hypothetical protein
LGCTDESSDYPQRGAFFLLITLVIITYVPDLPEIPDLPDLRDLSHLWLVRLLGVQQEPV